jgi:succinate dehydrogenase/fumarate reductase-like Fe-S protein
MDVQNITVRQGWPVLRPPGCSHVGREVVAGEPHLEHLCSRLRRDVGCVCCLTSCTKEQVNTRPRLLNPLLLRFSLM